ncbi:MULTISPECIES: hypothetical protein [unclassified Microbacterium]|uniref:hypothetical protein n=1 Tax=unclassified Microbacterium TaxID=2609290 RepID=UPI001604E54B|nr:MULTISPECIES: hypothetical protein [unclassified Microbacterium]QNA93369.1 hypothetical protein G4G29_15535 [Microbacterium sp. Se63.02b]QYM63594.1 hypothetical protein K1X59_15575 [Microbacterium sp. Se5.02b]
MTDVWADIATEFLHFYPRGRRLLTVAGADAERSRQAADELATALTASGQHVVREHSPEGEEGELRTVVSAFREGPKSDDVLLVSGPAALIGERTRGMWNYALWQLAGDEPPHTVAGSIVDVSDPAHPKRRFADYCALPASYGA